LRRRDPPPDCIDHVHTPYFVQLPLCAPATSGIEATHLELPAERYPHAPLLDRIWELRHNFAAHDAVYVALAEATSSVFYTCDEKLRSGHRAQVAVVTR